MDQFNVLYYNPPPPLDTIWYGMGGRESPEHRKEREDEARKKHYEYIMRTRHESPPRRSTSPFPTNHRAKEGELWTLYIIPWRENHDEITENLEEKCKQLKHDYCIFEFFRPNRYDHLYFRVIDAHYYIAAIKGPFKKTRGKHAGLPHTDARKTWPFNVFPGEVKTQKYKQCPLNRNTIRILKECNSSSFMPPKDPEALFHSFKHFKQRRELKRRLLF